MLKIILKNTSSQVHIFGGSILQKLQNYAIKRFLLWNVFIEVLLQKLLSFLLFFIVDNVLNVQKNILKIL